MAIVETYVSPTCGGLILVLEGYGLYWAVWESGSSTRTERIADSEQPYLKHTLEVLYEWAPDLEPLKSFGDYFLFMASEPVPSGAPLVCGTRQSVYTRPIRAHQLQRLTPLDDDAIRFVRYWLDDDTAVDDSGRLTAWL